MKKKLEEGQLEEGVGWYTRRGKKVWRFVIYLRPPGSDKLIKRKQAGFATRAEAETAANIARFRVEHAGAGMMQISARPTLAELIEKRLPTIEAKSERVRATRILGELLKLLPVGFQVQSLETEHIRLYVEKRQADGVANSSINRDLNTIAATLNQAGEFFSSLKQWKTPKIPRPKVSQSRRERVISDDEYQRLLNYLQRPPDATDGKRPQDQRNAQSARCRVAQILQFAMLTGARHSEIMGFQWKSVHWEEGRILIYQSKTDRYKQIPITTPLRTLLMERQRSDSQPLDFVFSSSGKIYPKFYRILREACEALGIPYGTNTPNGLILHSARHTVTTRLIQAGLDLDTTGQITGHSAKELIAHYSHHSPQSMLRAAAALEKIGEIAPKD